MKLLDGHNLAGFIKERQARQVRSLRQAHNVHLKLAIVRTSDDPRIISYIKLKQAYGADIGIEVEEHAVAQAEALGVITQLNQDASVTAIILQLPLAEPSMTEELLNAVAPEKDVDGLGKGTKFDPATPMAILWLLAGYNIDLNGKNIVIVGQGRLVGGPLARMLTASGIKVTTVSKHDDNLLATIHSGEVVVTATGVPGLITSEMLQPSAIVIDAGVATDAGKLVGDVALDVRERHDLTITPEKGGVGPLTVCALFDNVIRAGQRLASTR